MIGPTTLPKLNYGNFAQVSHNKVDFSLFSKTMKYMTENNKLERILH